MLKNLTGENLTGDLLSATLWGYFANHAVLGALSQPPARMIDQPDLSYGLFHLHAQPIKLYGTLTTRVEFKGLNLDIGHLRWSQANDP